MTKNQLNQLIKETIKEGTYSKIFEEYVEFVKDTIFNIIKKGYDKGLSLKEIKDIIIDEVDASDDSGLKGPYDEDDDDEDEEDFDENEWIKSKVTNTGQMGGNDKARFNNSGRGTM